MKPYSSLVDECLETECPSGHWCLLKELIKSARRFEPRFLVQMKCIEILKHNLGKSKPDITFEEACKEWADRGYAACFAEVYAEQPDLHPVKLYDEVIRICDITT